MQTSSSIRAGPRSRSFATACRGEASPCPYEQLSRAPFAPGRAGSRRRPRAVGRPSGRPSRRTARDPGSAAGRCPAGRAVTSRPSSAVTSPAPLVTRGVDAGTRARHATTNPRVSRTSARTVIARRRSRRGSARTRPGRRRAAGPRGHSSPGSRSPRSAAGSPPGSGTLTRPDSDDRTVVDPTAFLAVTLHRTRWPDVARTSGGTCGRSPRRSPRNRRRRRCSEARRRRTGSGAVPSGAPYCTSGRSRRAACPRPAGSRC